MRISNLLAPWFLVVLLVLAAGGGPAARAADLVPDLSRPLGAELAWPLDLTVARDGTMYVLGRDAADRSWSVLALDPKGTVLRSFGERDLSSPLRIAVTDRGRVVVSEICRRPDCTPALVVFDPAGRRERVVDLPRGTVTQVVSFGGETVGMVTQYMAADGARLGYRLVDVARGVVLSARDDLLPAAGVDRLQVQKEPSLDNCLRDVFLAPLPGGRFVAGYSGENVLRTFTRDGRPGGSMTLPPFTPRLLTPRAAAGEWDAEDVARAAGRTYRPDERCGYYRGIAVDDGGNVVLAGRGEEDGAFLAAVVGPDGHPAGIYRAPCELNWTFSLRGKRAWAICPGARGGWILRRFTVR